VKAGVPVADIGCALFATYAILSAYIGCQATGRGQYIDASLFEAAMAFSIWDVCDYWGTGRIPTPVGTANRMSAPYQAVRAADGWFVMGRRTRSCGGNCAGNWDGRISWTTHGSWTFPRASPTERI
jgi:formyl-CoA transferase